MEKIKISLTIILPLLLSGCFDTSLPECDSKDVTGLFSQMIKPTGYTYIDMKDIKEEGYNKESEIRLCSGKLSTTAGAEEAEYHIKWQNKKDAAFYVEFVR